MRDIKLESGCTIIKTKELNSLHSTIVELKKTHQEELDALKKEVTEHEVRVKPDEIDVNIVFQGQERYSYMGSFGHSARIVSWFSPIGGNIRTKFSFSSGIKTQLFKIIKLISNKCNDQYESELNSILTQAKKSGLKAHLEGVKDGLERVECLFEKKSFIRGGKLKSEIRNEINKVDNSIAYI